MRTPEADDQIQTPPADPSDAELAREFSDADLKERGLEFAAKYLMFKELTAKGYHGEMDYRGIEDRLKVIFPVEEGGWSPAYSVQHTVAFNAALKWTAEKYYLDWKIGKVAHYTGMSRERAAVAVILDDTCRKMAKILGISLPPDSAERPKSGRRRTARR